MIDTDGEPLRQAVRAEPDVVSPNVLEAEELVGHEFAGEEERSLAVREIAALGPARGDHDAARRLLRAGARRRPAARCKRARIEPREPIAKRGSGDAFLAGYLAARYEGRAPDQCLRFGVACGAESTGAPRRRADRPARGAAADGRRRARARSSCPRRSAEARPRPSRAVARGGLKEALGVSQTSAVRCAARCTFGSGGCSMPDGIATCRESIA